MPITVDIDVMLARRNNGPAKAVRFTTLEALCEVLECQPGDLLRWEADGSVDDGGGAGIRG